MGLGRFCRDRNDSPGRRRTSSTCSRFYGPTCKAFGALDSKSQARLAADIEDLSSRFNRGRNSFVVPAEYLEVVIER